MLKTRYFFIFIFLCGILSFSKASQEQPVEIAFRLFNSGDFFAASIAFERAAFYDPEYANQAWYRYYKALCYKELGQPERTLQELEKIKLYGLADTLFQAIRYEQAYCHYELHNYTLALWSLEEINQRTTDSLALLPYVPLKILCLNALGKWSEATDNWNFILLNTEISESAREVYQTTIKELYSNKNIPKYYSQKKARNLSRIIPGSGQVYCGEILEGSVNLLLNSAILGFSLYQFYTRFYFTGYIAGLTIFNKTYNGGIKRAAEIAQSKNDESIKVFNQRSGQLLVSLYGNVKEKD